MAKEKVYPYAVARIRVLEKNLLTKQTFSQMAEAKSAEDAFRMMLEAGYGGQNETVSVRGYEMLLSRSLAEAYALLKSLAPEEQFADVFLVKNDYHNCKVLLKQHVSGRDGKKYLVDGGTIPLGDLEEAVLAQDYHKLPKELEEACKKALELYQKTQNGQILDLVLDRAVFIQMAQLAKKTGSQFLMDYVARLCDLTNLKSFLRVKNMGKGMELFRGVFVPGGTLAESIFAQAFAAENPIPVFRATPYGEACERGMKEGFTEFEKRLDDDMMAFMKKAKYEALTVEPLIAYLYAKETEVKTLRIIMTSKLNQIEPEVIKERLRDAYV